MDFGLVGKRVLVTSGADLRHHGIRVVDGGL